MKRQEKIQLLAVLLGFCGFWYAFVIYLLGAFSPEPFLAVVAISPVWIISQDYAPLMSAVFWALLSGISVFPRLKAIFFSLLGLHYLGVGIAMIWFHFGCNHMLQLTVEHPDPICTRAAIYLGWQLLLVVIAISSKGEKGRQ